MITAAALLHPHVGFSQTVLFQQDFGGSADVSDFVSSTDNNFDAIVAGSGTTIAIIDGALVLTKSDSGTSLFARTTDLTPAPSAALFQFDLSVTGNSAEQSTSSISGVSIYVGSGLTNGATAEANSAMTARINVGWTANSGEWNLIPAGNHTASSNFSGFQTVRWYINNGATAIAYTGADNSSQTVDADSFDLWIGTTRVFEGESLTTTSVPMTDFKFRWNSSVSSATLAFDNFSISAIPESAAFPAGCGLVALFAAFGIRRMSRSSR